MNKETNHPPADGMSNDSILSSIQSFLKPIDFHETAGIDDDKKVSKAHFVVTTVEIVLGIAKEMGYSLTVKNSKVYLYNGQYWKGVSQEIVEDFLGQCAERLGVDMFHAKYHVFRTDLYKQFISSSLLRIPERPTEEVLINLKNGTFSITPDTQALREFRRDDFMTYQLPFGYDPNVTAPTFKKYLDRVLPDKEQQMVLAEFIGYVFIKHKTLKLEKFLILLGDGANGKSVFFDIISELLGKENVSNFSLQSLTNDTGYHRAMLTDKLVNYSPEISTQMNSTIFKQLVSGEKVEARFPFGRPFILEDYAKLIFNTNDLPKDVEQNHAFFRRFLIIHFAVTIPENERDPELAKRIIAAELPGVFNWVLEGLKRLLIQKKFTHSKAISETLEQYRKDSDTVLTFLIDEGFEKSIESEMKLSFLYQSYVTYCRQSGFKSGSNKLFSKRLKTQGFNIWRKNKGYYVDAGKIVFSDPSHTSPSTFNTQESEANAQSAP